MQQCERFIRDDDTGELCQCPDLAAIRLTMADRGGEYDEYFCAECAEVMRLIVEADPGVSLHYEEAIESKEQVAA